jgi:hypothetical protein
MAMILGLLVISVYGLYQFYNFPPWDAYWLNESKYSSGGAAFAEAVRIFGPLNAPPPFGFALMGGLIMFLVARTPWRIPAAIFGFPALALCGVRSAWGGFAIGAIMVIWQLGGKTRLRFIVLAIIVAALAFPILSAGPIASVVSNRFSSLSNLQEDGSFQARETLYIQFLETALSAPMGAGFGQIGVAAKLTTGQTANFDSGILELPYEFGWVAGLVCAWCIITISLRILGIFFTTDNPMIIGAAALFFAMLSELVSVPILLGLGGMITWIAAGLVFGASTKRSV